ncbi:MAG: hypothetical protein L0Z55_03970 [Planctomycetes bacterium]|nr:hypothetical protein [Planctomycetota bacterium]
MIDSRRVFSGNKNGARALSIAAALGGLLLSAGLGSYSADEVSIERLDFVVGRPRTITVYPGVGSGEVQGEVPKAGKVYWYLTYTLTNASDRDAKFFVTVSAKSDDEIQYSDLALAEVESKIEQLERRKLHSKADLLAADQPPNSYEAYAKAESKECVAIFNTLDPEAHRIAVRVYGLVNDLVQESLGDRKYRITERVLELVFERPGDEFYTSLDKFKFGGQKWVTVMREITLPPPNEK